jgi:hypothetical protein
MGYSRVVDKHWLYHQNSSLSVSIALRHATADRRAIPVKYNVKILTAPAPS